MKEAGVPGLFPHTSFLKLSDSRNLSSYIRVSQWAAAWSQVHIILPHLMFHQRFIAFTLLLSKKEMIKFRSRAKGKVLRL